MGISAYLCTVYYNISDRALTSVKGLTFVVISLAQVNLETVQTSLNHPQIFTEIATLPFLTVIEWLVCAEGVRTCDEQYVWIHWLQTFISKCHQMNKNKLCSQNVMNKPSEDTDLMTPKNPLFFIFFYLSGRHWTWMFERARRQNRKAGVTWLESKLMLLLLVWNIEGRQNWETGEPVSGTFWCG